ncbi:hypothetical protein [Parapedobacter lycopersici]|uniref:hypothetical protein n=1 Tax=Parapedobacter lycopersici TaxID=1864939 RepID=UPI00333F50B2
MKITNALMIIAGISAVSCTGNMEGTPAETTKLPIVGTWKLLTAKTIENGDTTTTDYTKDRSFIKIINDTHFAFLHHDLHKGKDSLAFFSAGGGDYVLKDSLYTEHLEYSDGRDWEGNTFDFHVNISNDTLTQRGLEQVESAGVNREIVETYIRVAP